MTVTEAAENATPQTCETAEERGVAEKKIG